jgi:hypothetical protein
MAIKEFSVAGFTRISAHWALELEIDRGDAFGVSISGSDTQVKNISVTLEGDQLKIGYNLNLISVLAAPFSRMLAKITLPDLRELDISGAARGTIKGFNSENDFGLYVSGASRLDITEMTVGNLKWDLSGASRINGNIKVAKTADFRLRGASRLDLQGSAQDLVLDGEGASQLELADFPVHNAKVILSGASRSSLNVDTKLDVTLEGASHLEIKGQPAMGETRISGASSFHKR